MKEMRKSSMKKLEFSNAQNRRRYDGKRKRKSNSYEFDQEV